MKNGCANYITTLTIAGSDSCGGAGVQADVKTMSALGCYAATAITAITVQNTLGVTAVHAVPPEIVAGQIRVVMDDIRPRAVKVGMVNDTATIIAIADALKDYDVEHIVVDPVMVATSGSRLMQDDAVEVFCKQLLPLATLLTPNIPETEVLSGITVSDKESMDSAALRILQLGCSNLLVKGGHLEGKKIDRLYGEVEREYVGENVVTPNTHGTGCTLSSAITSFLAQGLPVDEAIGAAKEWLTKALRAGADVEIGKGHGPVNHFFDPIKMKICPSNN
ncbi:bifunctional hydroxymethylpyrimidine kinase/phosphomethylpyrimidine kinase [Prevotella sp. P2-180]|uniref:bifunctional hydroxymethylpyrimidine kinase/phosphomethylpyrimidine kinase n=1 Tax=Prevotella sp. P2-180 TaxID=2024224 RepID=UPI000B9785A4|nr:bifunctional hydroxymethylpyrimidine kinase/phosphomethylpyrimidine kinase [Prevotella sp. P2-180]OYP68108.1 bifunctional hydroxymethylpyrimidine kinase/phosphomethylpyrimidine kinase [Prevotella sp. P2-180]